MIWHGKLFVTCMLIGVVSSHTLEAQQQKGLVLELGIGPGFSWIPSEQHITVASFWLTLSYEI